MLECAASSLLLAWWRQRHLNPWQARRLLSPQAHSCVAVGCLLLLLHDLLRPVRSGRGHPDVAFPALVAAGAVAAAAAAQCNARPPLQLLQAAAMHPPAITTRLKCTQHALTNHSMLSA